MAGFQIFGFEIKKKKEEKELGSVVSPASDDGSTVISSSAASYYGLAIDLEGTVKNENALIKRYREVAQYPDCDAAIEDIVNDGLFNTGTNSVIEELKNINHNLIKSLYLTSFKKYEGFDNFNLELK